MIEEYNDLGTINVRATAKNMTALAERDLALCIRNILVQRALFGVEDTESLAHSTPTVLRARDVIARGEMIGHKLSGRVVRTVKDLRDRWDFEGRLELRP